MNSQKLIRFCLNYLAQYCITSLAVSLLQVVQYNYRPHERDPHDLSWVDTSIDAVLNRICVKLSATFLANVLVSFIATLHDNVV